MLWSFNCHGWTRANKTDYIHQWTDIFLLLRALLFIWLQLFSIEELSAVKLENKLQQWERLVCLYWSGQKIEHVNTKDKK